MEQEDIAVIGVSALFPGAVDKDGFWRNILAGNDLITDVPESHWLIADYYDPDPSAPDKTYSKRGGFLSEIDFDPLKFSIPPTNLKATDTSQLLALIVAQKVLEDACNYQFNKLDRDKISVILGVASATDLVVHLGSRIQRPFWAKALRDNGYTEQEVEKICDEIADLYVPWQESSFPGLLGNVVAGRIANHFDLKGTNTVLDAACASSLSAVSMAIMELQSGRSEMVITGGVDTLNDIWMYMCFSKTKALSVSGDCRPFSDRADGTLLGEGIGMVALKRLSDAEDHGDRIYAVIKGVGSSSDGKSKSIYAPRSEGQALALNRAYDQAGYGPQTVELVEAHGTGTKAGDAAEFAGLKTVFQSGQKQQWCALGTVKSQIGHTKAAAGAAGLFKVVMALHHKILPPTIKVDTPNPNLNIEHSPFYINTESRPWIRGNDFPRRASVSAFGFGGSNFHLTLEEYTNVEHRHEKWRTFPAELFLIASDSIEKLLEDLQGFVDSAASYPHANYETHMHLARQSQMGFEYQKSYRVAVIASDLMEMTDKLKKTMVLIRSKPNQSIQNNNGIYYDTHTIAGKVAFLFPGQGSQYVNMGKELAMHFDVVREVWDSSTELNLDSNGEYRASQLHQFVFPPPAFDEEARQLQHKQLTDTRIAQPAIGTMSLSMVKLLHKLGLQADCMGGHSYGEITALTAAGILSDHDMLNIAHKRGQLMHSAAKAHQGAMTAVMALAETLQSMIDSLELDVVIANYNSPEQVVISGLEAEIVQLEQELRRGSIQFSRLPVSTAFHSKLIESSVEPFTQYLDHIPFNKSELPVYANLTGEPYPEEPAQVREQLAKQLANPVRFTEQIQHMVAAGVRLFIEVGPDKVLTGLVKRILHDVDVKAIALDRRGQQGILTLWQALAQLSVWGIQLDLAGLWEGFREMKEFPVDDKPTFKVKISGVNYGKPYPAKETNTNYKDRQVLNVETSNHQQQNQHSIAKTNTTHERPMSSAAYIQRQMTEAHLAFQKALTDSHNAYLRSTEKILSAMTGQQLTNESNIVQNQYDYDKQEVVYQTRYVDAEQSAAMYAYEAPTIQIAAAQAFEATQATQASKATQATQAFQASQVSQAFQVPDVQAAPMPMSHSHNKDVKSIMLQVVSEKTGYPQEMVDMDIDLESGLGIDSIKRVEILSAAQENVAGLPEFDPSEMASLHTLSEIVDFMEQKLKKN
jgi:polyketide-type polyunsaturated fatty acid synthase PfaA